MRNRTLRYAIGLIGTGLFVALIAGGIYRMYGPGDMAERLLRFQTRWAPFYKGIGTGTALNYWSFIGQGLVFTLQAAVVSILLSLVFGTGLALLRLTHNQRLRFPAPTLVRYVLSAPATTLIQAIRSAPLFLLILYTFIAAPKLGLQLTPLRAGIFALTLYTSCVLAEIIRAGILSLDKGQFEAADALGLSYAKKLRFVVLPQALRRMTPSVVSQLVTLIKDTSLLSLITVTELYRRLYIIQQQAFNPIETFIVAGAIYFVINFALSTIARRMEVSHSRLGGAAKASVQGLGIEDQTLVTQAAATSGKKRG